MQNLSQPFPKTSASFEQQKKQGNQQTRQGASCIKTRKGRLQPRIPEPTIPPTPYVNQAAVEQHMRAQSPPVPPRNTATVAAPPQESPGTSIVQEPLIMLATLQQTPPQAQEQPTRP